MVVEVVLFVLALLILGSLIPYTQEHTNLGRLQVGTLLNLETDILGRYVVQFLCQQGGEA